MRPGSAKRGGCGARVRATFDPVAFVVAGAPGNIWEGAGERASGASSDPAGRRRSVVQRDMQLLEHEQVHFDLAESGGPADQNAVRGSEGRVRGAWRHANASGRRSRDIDRELQEEQRRYDRETGHGTNEAAQARWGDRVRKLLR